MKYTEFWKSNKILSSQLKNSEIKEHPCLIEIHKCIDSILNILHCTIFRNFIAELSILLASEASSEWVFAHMRDLLNIKQIRLSEKALRSNIILGFYAEHVKAM